jgi:hypothetical protein
VTEVCKIILVFKDFNTDLIPSDSGTSESEAQYAQKTKKTQVKLGSSAKMLCSPPSIDVRHDITHPKTISEPPSCAL